VRDAMRAYWEALLHCRAGEAYNIGGTTTMTVGEFLDRLIAISEVPVPTRCDPGLLRPADVTLQVPCTDKFVRETGWRPLYTFEQSLADLLDYWRKQASVAAQTTLQEV
jgi:GDP-4-dehydro-6-deoxy-D-mannose reductase